MKSTRYQFYILFVISLILVSAFSTNCKKTEDPIKYRYGTFPDTVDNIVELNTQYDDYNTTGYQLQGTTLLIFSSNRKSAGKQFDLEQGSLSFVFDQTTGSFGLTAAMTTDPFIDKLINKANTAGNDFGPYRIYSAFDGYEYLVLSSTNAQGNLDLYYLKNRPLYSYNTLPDVEGPFPVKLMNTSYDDAYLSFNGKQDSAYFTSNRDGNFDIFMNTVPAETEFSKWFNQDFSSSIKVDSINSSFDDKCPVISNKIMVFTSNRPGGLGGYDLYYSAFRKGKWGSPVNFGAPINSAYDEYRPLIGYNPDFTNNFLIFSSNRPGGKGGFDLYFTGVTFPQK